MEKELRGDIAAAALSRWAGGDWDEILDGFQPNERAERLYEHHKLVDEIQDKVEDIVAAAVAEYLELGSWNFETGAEPDDESLPPWVEAETSGQPDPGSQFND